jgi:hypothetical protein
MSTPVTPSRQVSNLILAGLVLLLLISRFQPVEHFLEIPDASWAVFFIAGFYLSRQVRWVFPLLLVEAVLIDWAATTFAGVSDFCITPSYVSIVPVSAVMWFGGHWLRRHADEDLQGLLALAGSAVLATTLAYAISNGGFYWFGGRYPDPNWTQFVDRFFHYYRWFLLVPCAYIAAAAVVHAGIVFGLREKEAWRG